MHHLQENTHTRYAACIRLHLVPGLGTKKLARLTAKDVRTFLDRLRSTCQCCTHGIDAARRRCCAIDQCCHKVLSPLTVTYIHSVLKSALEHAVRSPAVPCGRTGGPAARTLRTALRTGLRKGELLGLRWKDLDLDSGTANIHRSLQRTQTSGLIALPTKTRASERRIALPSECSRSVKERREHQEGEREAAGVGWTDVDLDFSTSTGGPLDPYNLTRSFRGLLNQAGLRRICFHDLRHSTATLLLEQGIDLVVIKALLGHAHIGVTAGVYAHVRLRLQRHAINTLGNVLSPGDDAPDDPPTAAVVR